MPREIRTLYPNIRKIPAEAWKKKAWPITQSWEEIKLALMGKQAELFERKKGIVKERLPYKDDDESEA